MWQWREEWSTNKNKGKLWQNHDASVGAAEVGKGHVLGRSDIEQWENQAHSLSGYRITFVRRH